MAMKSPRTRDMEKFQSVRFGSVQYVDEPRSSTDSELAARPHMILPRRSLRSRIISPDLIPWLLTCVFATTTILLLMERPQQLQYGTYEMAFITDIKSLGHVPIEIKRFSGSPNFDENGTMYNPEVDDSASWPDNLDFTSQSKEADKNWLDLLEDRYFSISEDEAIEAWGEDRHAYVDQEHGGYTAGLDVFHTLNCLNEIRMALHPDRYTWHHGMPVDVSAERTAYCLDAIRQHVQCYGSATLVPTRYRETARKQSVDSDQEHVCRDFAYLKEFVERRSPTGDLYVPRDMALGQAAAAEVEIKKVEGEVPA